MSTPTTPTKSSSGTASSPSAGADDIWSPTKRSIDFDLWNEDSYFVCESSSKKIRKDSEEDKSEIVCIADLTEESVSDTIEFRCVLKKIFITESNGKTTKTLRFHAMDGSGEISAVCFNERAEELDKLLKVNQCFTLKNFQVSPQNPRYPDYTGHQFTMKITAKSEMEESESDIAKIDFNFIDINEIESKNLKDHVDLLAVVGRNWGLEPANERWGQSFRNLTLTRGTDCIRMTLIGKEAEEFGDENLVVVALRRAHVSIFDKKKCLNARGCTLVWKNPKVPGAEELLAACKPKLQQLFERIEQKIAQKNQEFN